MSISVYIDSCAWNYLHENRIDLKIELPSDLYSIFITREVKIEIESIPESEAKKELRKYIKSNIETSTIQTTSVFGFMSLDPDGTPSKTQVYGGFGQGTFQSQEEREFYLLPEIKGHLEGKGKTNSGLNKNQGDASLAVKAQTSIILTNEKPNKSGPLKVATERGGQVVSLEYQVKPTGLSIGKYLESFVSNSP